MKVDFNSVSVNTQVGFIQVSIERIVDNILNAVKDGKDLEKAIRFADCSELDGFSEETPIALPLDNEKGQIIGLTIQCNELVKDPDEETGNRWETFYLISVEVPAFAKIKN